MSNDRTASPALCAAEIGANSATDYEMWQCRLIAGHWGEHMGRDPHASASWTDSTTRYHSAAAPSPASVPAAPVEATDPLVETWCRQCGFEEDAPCGHDHVKVYRKHGADDDLDRCGQGHVFNRGKQTEKMARLLREGRATFHPKDPATVGQPLPTIKARTVEATRTAEDEARDTVLTYLENADAILEGVSSVLWERSNADDLITRALAIDVDRVRLLNLKPALAEARVHPLRPLRLDRRGTNEPLG